MRLPDIVKLDPTLYGESVVVERQTTVRVRPESAVSYVPQMPSIGGAYDTGGQSLTMKLGEVTPPSTADTRMPSGSVPQ